jgi:hypothetical protein
MYCSRSCGRLRGVLTVIGICCCREALIRELRDACLCVADAPASSTAAQQLAEMEGRVRELHAALEAASGQGPAILQQAAKPEDSPAPGTPRDSNSWAIAALRPAPAEAPAAAPAARSIAAKLKTALRQPQGSRPASPAQQPRSAPTTADAAGRQPPATSAGLGQWPVDDGLAEFEAAGLGSRSNTTCPSPGEPRGANVVQPASPAQSLPGIPIAHAGAGGALTAIGGLLRSQGRPDLVSWPLVWLLCYSEVS